jgi:GNAT superfamily N-acetyltransferase
VASEIERVIANELALLRPEVRSDPDAVSTLLHDDFREFGASGRVWDRDAVVRALPTEDERALEARDIQAFALAPDVILVTYAAQESWSASLRSSIWVRVGDTWRVRFHQGTPSLVLSPHTIRRATPADSARLTELMFVHPSREATALAGNAERAERFERALLAHVLASSHSEVWVVERAGQALGFAETTVGSGTSLPELARVAVSAYGYAGAVRAAVRARTRARVDFSLPPDALHLVELQVHPRERNAGIGGELLRYVEGEAHRRGIDTIVLTTAIDNPARRLYDRHGFRVAGEKRDAGYEQRTGVPGRVLMTKTLGG